SSLQDDQDKSDIQEQSGLLSPRSQNSLLPEDDREDDVKGGSGVSLSQPSVVRFSGVLPMKHDGSIHILLRVGEYVWAGCGDGSISVWDPKTRTRIALLNTGHQKAIYSMILVDG